MTASAPTSTMRAWQYSITKGGLEKNMKLNPTAPIPQRKDPSTQHIVEIFYSCLNPIDYKPAEGLPSFVVAKPATPGLDFAGRILEAASGSKLKKGQLVFGCAGLSPLAGAAFADQAIAKDEAVAPVPDGVSASDASTIGVAGLTAYQTIVPHVKQGDRIFINGGSGGTGVFGIQIAKVKGCHVTTTCSTGNVELCKSIGADEVIDYKTSPLLETLKKQKPFDHVVDNVGGDTGLYFEAHHWTTPTAKFINVAGMPTVRHFANTAKIRLWPSFLGGGKRKYMGFFAQPRPDELAQIATWMKEGKVKAIVDSKFAMEQAPAAMARLKTGRSKGKVMVEVQPEA